MKKIFLFVLTLAMFAAMTASAFAYTCTDAELRELVAMTPSEADARGEQWHRERGGYMDKECVARLQAIRAEIQAAKQIEDNARTAGLAMWVPEGFEWAAAELKASNDMGLRNNYGSPLSNPVLCNDVTGDILKVFERKGYDYRHTYEKLGITVGEARKFALEGELYLIDNNVITGNTVGYKVNEYGNIVRKLTAEDTVYVTRQDFAVLYARVLRNIIGITDNGATVTFKDADKFTAGSDYTVEEAKAAAQLLANLGIMGTGGNVNFNPNANINIAEKDVAQYRLYNAIPRSPECTQVVDEDGITHYVNKSGKIVD